MVIATIAIVDHKVADAVNRDEATRRDGVVRGRIGPSGKVGIKVMGLRRVGLEDVTGTLDAQPKPCAVEDLLCGVKLSATKVISRAVVRLSDVARVTHTANSV